MTREDQAPLEPARSLSAKQQFRPSPVEGEQVAGAYRIQGIGVGHLEQDEDSAPDLETPGEEMHDTEMGEMDTAVPHTQVPTIDEVDEEDEGGDFVDAPPPSETSSMPVPVLNQKREINPDFKDVQNTGKWGGISRAEKVGAFLFLLVVVVVVVAVVVLVRRDDDDPKEFITTEPISTMEPTLSPTGQPTDPEIQLSQILSAINSHEPVQDSLSLLPDDVTYYEDKASDSTAPAVVRAMSWILFDDPRDSPEFLVFRYALAVLYYNNGGGAWKSSNGWMTDAPACDWFGVGCDHLDKIRFIDLPDNDVTGTIPVEMNLLDDLRSLILRDNMMTGTLPALGLGTIPELTYLYLNGNQLSGAISKDLRSNEVLGSLLLHFNSFNGTLPSEFCLESAGQPPILILDRVSLDCEEVTCFCCQGENAECY